MTAEDAPDGASDILHASCVAVAGRAVLIRGNAGSGKSTLALELMAFGAQLIADDRTCVVREGGQIIASAPDTIRGAIEIRGIGLVAATVCKEAPIAVVVDLDNEETDRMPPPRTTSVLGVSLPLHHKIVGPHFPAAVLQYLKSGLWTET